MSERLVVIGGDAAGMSAASQARRRRDPDDLEIVAFERGNYTSYSACGIPYFVGGAVKKFDALIARTPEVFRRDYSIETRMRHEVTEIDLERRAVKVLAVDDGTESWEPFDDLMVATGAVPIRPPIPGIDVEGIHGVQTLDDGRTIFEDLEKNRPKCGVVIGAGYIGLEMAEALRARGMEVSVVEKAAQPMSTLDPEMAALVVDGMTKMGIRFLPEEGVTGFEARSGRVSAVVTEAQTLRADIVILGLGVSPNIELARGAGIPIGSAGGIEVDRRMRTGVDRVWSAGDCAEKFHIVSQVAVTIPLGTHANKEGRVAGINIGGGYATFPGVAGTAMSKVCETELARTGLIESEALEAGFEIVSTVTESTTRAGYFPGTKEIRTKLVVDRRSGRLLGGQIVGEEGAAKRIDVLATAVWNEMTVDEILNLDLSYAPPFSPVWDPVLIAARKAWQAVEEATAQAD